MAEFNLSYTAEDINTKLGKIDTLEQDVNKLNNEKVDKANLVYVTPQMFGAVGDGVADDTAAVQAALNNGGLIYFPAGRYKVTNQLTATNPCKITMFKPYPSSWGTNAAADYPQTADDNYMGSRIETYATDGCGMLVGEGIQIDGFYMRAMDGFEGVLFKYDGTQGIRTYPSQVRLAHMILDNKSIRTVPEAMFDFTPSGTYFVILDDITIGNNITRNFCEYGFRSAMTADGNWANSIRIRNICIDAFADYPFYIEGGNRGADNWTIENLTVQAYPYNAEDAGYLYKSGHIDLVTLKNMSRVVLSGAHLYDLSAADYAQEFNLVNCKYVTCVGCGGEFEQIDTDFLARMGMNKNFNINALQMSLVTDAETGNHTLTLSDHLPNKEGEEHIKQVIIPAAVLSDKQVTKGVETWMDENAAPTYVVGKNKLNPYSTDNFEGTVSSYGSLYRQTGMFLTHPIPVIAGDVVRSSLNGKNMTWYMTYTFGADGKRVRSVAPSAQTVIIEEGEVAFRNCYSMSSLGMSSIDDVKNIQLCIMVNDSNGTYEPYTVTAEGGLGSYLILSSPNGTKYTLDVADDGTLTAKVVE